MAREEPTHLTDLRLNMVDEIVHHAELAALYLGKCALDSRVIAAIGKVPRHEFVPDEVKQYAYFDTPLPIGWSKTISQPFIAAVMTDLLAIEPSDRVLEIGTGRGYHAAVFAELAAEVFTVEIVEELGVAAAETLTALGYRNIRTRIGDGANGWAEFAPYDKMLLAASPERLPEKLIAQLKPGGRLVLPLGPEAAQELVLVTKLESGEPETRSIFPVRFAPLETSH